uniref:Coiled-coil domain-containing protein 130 homolog n=1 Tax=Meloidogyne hapla TaxID=6305 RepID=A0A1I8B275_MELHA
MGERKGQNKYYPPDFNWRTHKTLNSYHGVHALRERGTKANVGIITIRFEMPFNVWCLGCNNHIGMSVRYNAEKKKVGIYYTTPIYEFRMKCHLCDNYFLIRTDPKNFDYELVEGVRRQEIRFDPSTIDKFTEHTVEDKQKLAGDDQRIDKLEWIQSRLYDDFGANSALRSVFRTERKALTERRVKDADMQQRLSTEVALLPESKEDVIAAKRLALSKQLDVYKERDDILSKEKLMNQPILFEQQTNNSIHFGTSPSTSKCQFPKSSRELLVEKLQQKSVKTALENCKWNGDGRSVGGKIARKTLLGVKTNQKGNIKNRRTKNCISITNDEILEKDEIDDVKCLDDEKVETNHLNKKKDCGPNNECDSKQSSSLPGISIYNCEDYDSSNSEDNK